MTPRVPVPARPDRARYGYLVEWVELPEFPPPDPRTWRKPWEWPKPHELIFPVADLAVPIKKREVR